ncbi:MAG: hypothetical protein ACK5UJ_03960 [Pseudobdellovibrionaceae bacterium]
MKLAAVFFAAWMFSYSSYGQSTPSAPKERKQTLSFEDELVEGSTQKPELFYLFQKKNFN